MKRFACLCSLILSCLSVLPGQSRGISIDKADVEPQINMATDQACDTYAIAYSPDGKYIAAGYNNNEIRLWDATTGALVKTLTGHTGTVWSVAFSPDGKSLVSGSADKTIKCWDIETGKELRTLRGHTDTVSFVVYSTDGVYIASGSVDKTIKFWDPVNGKLLQTLSGHTKTIASIAYSHNGKYMASASWDKTVKIYYAVGGAEIRTLVGHTDAVFAVAFSPDGKTLASGSSDRSIKIWDTATGEIIRSITGYDDKIWSIAYSPDGKSIAGSSADGTIKIWDVQSGIELHALRGHSKSVRSIAYSANGQYLTSGDSGGLIKLWNASTGACLATMMTSKKGEWVTWTPEGFLTGSDWALNNLSYSANGKEYRIKQIYDKVYRPDLVSKKIGGGNLSKIAETDSLAAIVRTGTMPDVTFMAQRASEADRDALVSIRITNTGGGIGRVLLKLNDRMILISESLDSKVGQSVTMEYPVTLRNGENTISVSAYDSAGVQESAQSAQKLTWKGKTEKPRLFILAVAVNDYLDTSIDKLKNCIADADGVVESFSKYSGDIYSDVYVQKLIGPEVTKGNLDKTLEAVGKRIKPDDVFVFYLAGHGKTYTDGDYYYIPYDFKFTSEEAIAEGGISKWQLIKDLSHVQASHLMILLDTCDSGSFLAKSATGEDLEDADKRAIIDRFAEKAGYDMLAACSTYQYALDDYNGHGIFTYHVMEALQGFADLNKDGRVTSTELSYYVISEVPNNSDKKWGYKQEPQRVLPDLDFPLVGKENPVAPISLKKEIDAEAPEAVPEAKKASEPPVVAAPVSVAITTGRFTIPFLAEGSSVSIQGRTLAMEGSPAFRSPPLPVGTYEVTIAGKYPFTGKIAVDALTENKLSGYRDSIIAKYSSDRSNLQNSLSNKRAKTTWGIISLSTGLLGAAGTAGVYFLGTQAATAYSHAVDTASLASSRSQVELYGNLLPAAAAVCGLGLGLSPILLLSGPDPKTVQHSIDSLDEQIRALGNP